MPGFVGLPELLILGVVVLLVFGPKRLPEMGRSMGRGLREFKNSVSGDSKADFAVDEPDELEVTVKSLTAEPVPVAIRGTDRERLAS
jgi:sec-independent protein translocase protein TatA